MGIVESRQALNKKKQKAIQFACYLVSCNYGYGNILGGVVRRRPIHSSVCVSVSGE